MALFNRAWTWNWWGEPVAIAPPAPVLRILTVTPEGRKLITDSEGYSAVPYLCAAAVCTIGWGTTIGLAGAPITLDHRRINQSTAEQLFSRDLKIFAKSVRILVKVPINNNQFSALVSLSYNIGVGNLKASTLLRKLNRGDYSGCEQEFWKWRRAKGVILKGLVIRRERERLMFVS